MSEKGGEGEKERGGSDRSGPRKLAEWISLGISALLVLGIACYLIVAGVQPRSHYVPLTSEPLLNEVRKSGERYVLPIYVRNQGDRTMRELVIELSYNGQEGKRETQELTVDYLGTKSETKLYAYFEDDPASAEPEVRPLHYRLD